MRGIGGSPCSGKSTVAALIAATRGIEVYSCDAAFDRWMRRDIQFAELVATQAGDLGYRVILADGSVPAQQMAAAVIRR